MDTLELREAILCAPLAWRCDYDAALAQCTVTDLPALRSWVGAGLVYGQWRLAAIKRKIEELEREST